MAIDLNRFRKTYPTTREIPKIEVVVEATALDIIMPIGFDAGTSLVYLPLAPGITTTSTVITEAWVQFIAPVNLVITEVVLHSITINHGSTIVGTHIDGNTTPTDTDTQTLDITSGNVVFTLGTSVLKGERISISFDSTSDGGEVTGYIRLTPS